MIDYISRRLDIFPGETSADGKFSLEIVQCLAACDFAPAIKVNDELYGNITDSKIDNILSDLLSST